MRLDSIAKKPSRELGGPIIRRMRYLTKVLY
jgi:hypothetical protein